MKVIYQTYLISIPDATIGLISESLIVRENYTKITGIAFIPKSTAINTENRLITLIDHTGDKIVEETPLKPLLQTNRDTRMSKRFWDIQVQAVNQKIEVQTYKETAGALDVYIELRLERDE